MTTAGRRILVARPAAQSGRLLQLLAAAGWQGQAFPVMDIQPQPEALAQLPQQAAQADWLFFVSPSAIDMAWPTLQAQPLKAQLACVGQASARRLATLSGQDILFPTAGSDSEALLALPQLADVAGQHWLIVRGQGGRALLADTLRQRGATVTLAEVYQRVDGAPDWSLLDDGPPDAMVITSSEMAEQLFRLAGPARAGTLQCLLYCVPHPRIAERLQALGATRIVTTRADDDALVAGLREWFSRHP
ncbi:uroporphyrinogen-III synthase [Aquitalea sp. FJL05]|uniref:uroporphyrinogen-III synthase n=1 Tax=Aquitalea TaxID=407217 RepID=UPI000F5AB19A|nr:MULTISPECIES: uroporphyrinogen-III synthase [Aquitalea]RQO67113.1 uroporphyrinogen-III synthase [Aquitalea sp. FJL05]